MTDPTTSGGPAGLADRVQQIHVPEPNADRERLLLGVGVVSMVLGVVLIVVAYVGVSGTTSVPDQMSYAVSGGLLGLAAVIIGSSLVIRFSLARLFRYWLARVVYEHQVQTDRTVEALGRIEAVLAGGTPSASGTPSADGDTPRIRKEPLRAEPLEG
jgi:hypothetical protein